MEENRLRLDRQAHVAQQSRRDRLRIMSENLDNDDHVRNYRCSGSLYEPVVLSSGMINFSGGSSPAGPMPAGEDNPVDGGHWRNVVAQQSADWIVNCPTGLGGLGSDRADQNRFTDFNSPGYGVPDELFHDNVGNWSHGGAEEFNNVVSDWRVQGLSLTLSSNPRGFNVGEFNNSGLTCPVLTNPVISTESLIKSNKDVTLTYPSTGPLGPFTGYSIILKSSRFLKPAQQLLCEFCSVPGYKAGGLILSDFPERISGKGSALANFFDVSDHCALDRNKGRGGGSLGASSSMLYSSNDRVGEIDVKDQSSGSCQPEYLQKKAKLAYMHEEVCRRYNQYHEQMQMVVSSFESVAGLSDATPYISLALKTVSRHFRSLWNAIANQLSLIRKALGEESMFPTSSSTKGDASGLRQKYKEPSFQKHKSGGDNAGFAEPQQIWRPQRGLPERSVAILRTWLFEHFLHPYPTDTDKHMLAAQTGLSRNQVSNWFINARVRVWKPMVEEIHMLETNNLSQTTKTLETIVGEGTSCSNGVEAANNPSINALSSKHMEFPGIGSSADINDGQCTEQWSQEKRSRVERQIPQSVDRSFMGFLPYQRGGIEMGGLGAVSLTLGLRNSAENAQHRQREEDQLRTQFGGNMFHDFVG